MLCERRGLTRHVDRLRALSPKHAWCDADGSAWWPRAIRSAAATSCHAGTLPIWQVHVTSFGWASPQQNLHESILVDLTFYLSLGDSLFPQQGSPTDLSLLWWSLDLCCARRQIEAWNRRYLYCSRDENCGLQSGWLIVSIDTTFSKIVDIYCATFCIKLHSFCDRCCLNWRHPSATVCCTSDSLASLIVLTAHKNVPEIGRWSLILGLSCRP